ncbi:hypothetical protein [Nocardioides iriomotensis]|uniref:Nuclear transport factor 2 family protein n=1 Tax=Nocardioides iriomotensis TaxID=715784 RepID=A0A4Q5IUP6_9ACTN|nr:hypothetical protein [Nocardioides iriomotensis]RYU09473.1 hypothetical protein ETU37_20660 [Nocardioides iriomotensis]
MLGTSPSRALRCTIAAASLVVLAGCSGDPASGPEESASSADAPQLGDDSASGLDADQQAVFDTVEALNDWYAQALADPAKTRLDMRALRTLTGGKYTRAYGQQVAIQQSNGVQLRGRIVYTPVDVTVDGDRATAVTCFDNSEMEMYMTFAKPEEKVGTSPPTRIEFTLATSPDSPTGWEVLKRGGGGGCKAA